MKTILLLLCAILVIGAAQAKPSDYDEVKRAKLVEWVEQLRVIAETAKKNAEAAKLEVAKSQTAAAEAKAETAKLQLDIERLTQWGRDQWKRAEEQSAIATKEREARIKNGLQRDVFVFLFAAALTAAIFSGVWRTLTGFVSVTGPWGFAIIGGLALCIFAIIASVIRWILALIT